MGALTSRIPTLRLPPAAAIAAVAVALLGSGSATGCGSGPSMPAAVAMAGQPVPTARLLEIADGICTAARQAPADTEAARRSFFGQSHDGIHLIARGLDTLDRKASATLLEAKQKVEADFLNPPPGSEIAADLRRLAAQTRSSLARFKVRAPACPS